MTNARLKNVFSLSSKVTVYVPATININKEIDNKEFVDRAATLLSDCFGGATSTDALGYWTSQTAGLVKERTTMVFAYASEKDLRNKLDMGRTITASPYKLEGVQCIRNLTKSI